MAVVIVAVLVGRTGSALIFMEDLQLHYKKCYRFRVHVLGHTPADLFRVNFMCTSSSYHRCRLCTGCRRDTV